MRNLITALALGLQEHVLPYLGAHAGRTHVRAGAGGDGTFGIDTEAEAYLERFLAEHAPELAFYSEDRGLVKPSAGTATHVLVVDPIDGTRPALAGFESSCVSVAAAPLDRSEPAMSEVELGVVVEIKTGAVFTAERGSGVEVRRPDGGVGVVALSDNTEP